MPKEDAIASELAAYYVSIVASARGIQNSIGKELAGVESQAVSTGQSMGSKLAGGMAKTLKVGALAVGGAVAGILGTAIVKGFSRLSALENAQAKLTGLGHSAGTVTGIMENALAAVKGTAFGMDEAASAAAGAVAAGIKPGAELEGVLRLMGDAATIAGTDIGSMGAIFNKVASSNKIQGDVIAQLQDQGIPIVQLMAKELGVTAEETVKMASDGKISFEVFRKAMENGMGGAALKSGNTVSGAFKNMNAALGRFGAALLKDTYPLIGPVFGSLTEWIDKATEKVGPLATSFSQILFPSLQSIWGILSRGDFTGPIFGLEEDHKFIGYLFTLREAVLATFELGRQAVSAFTLAWKYNDGDITSSGFNGYMERAGYAARQLWDALRQLDFSSFSAFMASLSNVGGVAGSHLTSIGASLKTLAPAGREFAAQLPNITSGLTALAGYGLTVVTSALAFLAGNIDTIIRFMPLIVAGFVAWRVASAATASGMMTLQAAQLAMTPVVTLNNILRLIAIRGEQQLAIANAQNAAATIANTSATNVGVLAKTRAAASATMTALATANLSIAQRASAAAQWLMNAALTANPIGVVVVAVAALVAGLVYFFTQTETGRAIIETVWGAIKTFIGGIVVWFQTYVLPVIQSVFNAVGSVFSWLYNNVIKPVFDGVKWYIGAVVTWFQTYVLPVIQKVFRTVGDVFSWLYNNVVKPVFDGIKWWISVWWTGVSAIFQLVVAFFRNVLGPTFEWLWNGVAKPVFNAIGQLIGAFWNLAVKPIFEALISFIRNVLAVAFMWFKDNVIVPVWNAIQIVISAAWNNYIRPILDAIGAFIRNILAPAFTWLRDNVIRPVWDWIGSKISDVWNGKIKPVFDAIKTGVGLIPGAFEAAKNGIGTAWNAIKAKVKEPIVASIGFINTHLLGAFRKIPGITKETLPDLPLPPGFANGGRIPGYSPTSTADNIPIMATANEFMVRQQSAMRLERMHPGALDYINKYGKIPGIDNGYAKGGFIWPVGGQYPITQYPSGGHRAYDIGTPTGTPVKAVADGRVSHAGPGYSAPGVWGGTEVHVDHGGGVGSLFAHLSALLVRVGDMVRQGQDVARSGNTGISSGPHLHFGGLQGGMNMVSPDPWLNGAIPKGSFGGVGGGGGGEAPKPSNPLDGVIDTIMNKLKEAFPGAGMFVDVAGALAKTGVGQVVKIVTDIKDGISKIAGEVFGKVKDFFGVGNAAIAPTLYDNGGILGPGDHLVSNRTGKPEAIFTNEEAKALVSGRGNSEPTVHLHVENMFDSAENIVGELRTEIRRGVTSHNLRQVARVG